MEKRLLQRPPSHRHAAGVSPRSTQGPEAEARPPRTFVASLATTLRVKTGRKKFVLRQPEQFANEFLIVGHSQTRGETDLGQGRAPRTGRPRDTSHSRRDPRGGRARARVGSRTPDSDRAPAAGEGRAWRAPHRWQGQGRLRGGRRPVPRGPGELPRPGAAIVTWR